ncbi:hypothetical protein P691DRAFT_800107 [Macrolepiota fuliginosa MF-IS2]|uniref:Mid2 domain-containing protein n=1 Tax=Macrolepiota fuliginosa MF-IS2 TaxID=1400762 RepID=A0A9P5XTE8_9AGAR|nr:hypothetical protein P691DRAFT_800107 [Macrolepiota fuliginosa MF-IS2]
MYWIPFLLRIFVFSSWFRWVYGFDFVVSPPTSCGAVQFNWVGGTPPFSALAIPPGGTIRNFSIPANAWNDNDKSGSFSAPLQLAQTQAVVFSMGDATGVTAGGVTDVMTVGPPAGGVSCNTTDPGTTFFFAIDGTLSQCKPYPFTLYVESGAILPISILVTVPHGESFVLHPPAGNTFNWQANLTTGTSVIFTMSDSQSRIGGTSPLLVVGSSSDSSCITALPSSAAPTRTPTLTASSSPIATNTGGSNEKTNSSTGIIIGAAVGGAVVLLVLIALIYFCAKRNTNGRTGKRIDLTEPGPGSSAHLLGSQPTPYPPINPFTPYSDNVAPQASLGDIGMPMYNYGHHIPTGSVSTSMDAAGITGGVGVGTSGMAGAQAYQQYQQPPVQPLGAKQREREAITLRQQQQPRQSYHQQSYSQQDYNPYDTGATTSALPSNTAYASMSSRQTAQSTSDTQSQFGAAGSTSNYSTSAGPSTLSSTQSKQALNPAPAPAQRFVVHTDIEDEPIELPPMYSETRAPIPGMTPADAPLPRKGGML